MGQDSTNSVLGRRPRKRQRIVRELRDQIVNGELAPGERLPSHIALKDAFATGTVTVQQALKQLVDEGFVTADGQRGTFVTDHPPHLSHFAMIFPEDPRRSSTWSTFSEALDRVLEIHPGDGEHTIRAYYDAMSGQQSRDYPRLLRDLEHDLLAGLIFVSPPVGFDDTPFLKRRDLPRIVIAAEPIPPDMACVYFDYADFLNKAVARLAEAGASRVGLVTFGSLSDELSNALAKALREHGMQMKPHWQHHQSPWNRLGIIHLMRLLLASPDDRPDGLIVFDDNLLPSVMDGVAAAGMLRHLHVVSHTNFPFPVEAKGRAMHIGFDLSALLDTCVELLSRQVRDEPTPPQTLMPVVEA